MDLLSETKPSLHCYRATNSISVQFYAVYPEMTLETDHVLKLQYLIKKYSLVKGLMGKPFNKEIFL